jgi:GT2 family glycosyltransferase
MAMSSLPVDSLFPRAPQARADLRPVTACVINHNGERYLPDSLGAAVAQGQRFAEIILVDDASQDGSVDLARARFPGIRIVQLTRNAGAAAARNTALREAQTELVLLFDNDVTLAPDCASELVRALHARPYAAIAVPLVIYAHRPDTVQWAGAGCHYLGMQAPEGDLPLVSVREGVRPVRSLISACFLLDRARLARAETFDEAFFIYQEDHDLGVRVRAHGREIVLVPTARCHHGHGTAGLSVRLIGTYSRRRVLYLIRNRWRFMLKVYSLRSLAVLAPMLLLYELIQLVVALEKGWGREWLRAVGAVMRDRQNLLRLRREFQRSRTVPDRALLEGGRLGFRPELTVNGLERAAKRCLDGLAQVYWRCARRLV